MSEPTIEQYKFVIDFMYRSIKSYIQQCDNEISSQRKVLQSFHALNDCIESYTKTLQNLIKFHHQVILFDLPEELYESFPEEPKKSNDN